LEEIMGEILKKRLKQQKFSSVEQEGLLNLFIASNYLHQNSIQFATGVKLLLDSSTF
jgi:hypothetical protein